MKKPGTDLITEARNPSTREIDRLPTGQVVQLINNEDALVAGAVAQELDCVARAVDAILNRMTVGGRLFYVGAGTSGRLGILDAVECAPTFSLEEGRIVAIMAGGERAIFSAREGEEDCEQSGAEEMEKQGIGTQDAVLGISASGKTPYVLGALKKGREKEALTIGLACNKGFDVTTIVDIAIIPIVGPEVVTGSTRMKAGTAQKMVLNMISTTLMIKMGKVYSNLMVDLKPSNCKLRARACRIFSSITGASAEQAGKYLEASGYSLKEGVVMYKKGVNRAQAQLLLEKEAGNLRRVIG